MRRVGFSRTRDHDQSRVILRKNKAITTLNIDAPPREDNTSDLLTSCWSGDLTCFGPGRRRFGFARLGVGTAIAENRLRFRTWYRVMHAGGFRGS
jgi:hypothetical protein